MNFVKNFKGYSFLKFNEPEAVSKQLTVLIKR